eukprot:9068230-Prorocentrum_lima.AAC.1
MVELSAGGDSRCNPKCWRVRGCSAMAEWPGQASWVRRTLQPATSQRPWAKLWCWLRRGRR